MGVGIGMVGAALAAGAALVSEAEGLGDAARFGATIGLGGVIGLGGAIGIDGFGMGGVFSLMRGLLENCSNKLAKVPRAVKPPARDDAFFLV